MAEMNLGRIGFVAKGNFDPNKTDYKKLDQVTFEGSSFFARVNNPTGIPTADNSNLDWQLSAEKGDGFTYEDFTPDQLEGLKGEQGIQGIQGEQGPIGLQGPKGDPFVYDDFTPSQLEGLKGSQGIQGPKGDKGDPGTDGQDGYSPVKGIDYFDGVDGAEGPQGERGPEGPQGEEGPRGLEGPQGPKGDQGEQGEQGIQGGKGDRGDKGWNPKFVFEEDGATRLVKKLDSWIGGTGTAPTDNVGMYVTDGGYTSDKSLAENFKGAQSDNLLIEYVHSGNKEVYIDSIDYETNTFTSVGHELVAGNRLGLNLLKQINNTSQSPFTKLPVNTMVHEGFYLVNITTDTFQIAATNGGEPIALINESTLDLSFFRFEVVGVAANLSFSEINVNDIELKIVGGFARNPRYIRFKGESNAGFTSKNNSFSTMNHDNLWSLGGTYSISFITDDKEEVRQRAWDLLQFNPAFNNGVLNEIVYSIDNTKNSLLFFGGFSPYNGTTVKICKL